MQNFFLPAMGYAPLPWRVSVGTPHFLQNPLLLLPQTHPGKIQSPQEGNHLGHTLQKSTVRDIMIFVWFGLLVIE